MRLKLFHSVLNVTMHRVCRAANRSRDEFRIDVSQLDNGQVRTLSVLCDGVMRLYPVHNNSQWARSLMNDALDGCYAAVCSADGEPEVDSAAYAGPEALEADVAEQSPTHASADAPHGVSPSVQFIQRFTEAVQTLGLQGSLLSVGQAGPLCKALRQARQLDIGRAEQHLDRALQAPGLHGDGALSEPGLELAFIERQFKVVRTRLTAQPA